MFEVAGVVKCAEYESYGEEPRVYMPFSVYSTSINTNAAVTCYELVLPEPIDGFSEKTAEKAVSLDERYYELKINSARYDIDMLLKSLGGFMKRGTRDSGIYYPHWENNALIIENGCILLALCFTVSAAVSGLSAVTLATVSLMQLTKFISEYKEKHRR